MNIWGLILILVLLLWGFYEYLIFIIRKLKEIKKDYIKLLEMRKDLNNILKDFNNDKENKN